MAKIGNRYLLDGRIEITVAPRVKCEVEKKGMEIGVYHEFHCRPEQTPAEAFAEALDQIEAADRWGLDAIWLAEIHQQARRSVMSADDRRQCHCRRTKRIEIGTGVQVLPLCHPCGSPKRPRRSMVSHGRCCLASASGNRAAYGLWYLIRKP
jgi:hypothetical protein